MVTPVSNSPTDLFNAAVANILRIDLAAAYAPTYPILGAQVPNPAYQSQQAAMLLLGQLQNGSITLTQAVDSLIKMAGSSTTVASLSYLFFTGGAPSSAGFDFLLNSQANPADLNDPYYAQFTAENRFINFAVNLGKLGEGATKFAADYANLTLPQALTKAYTAIFGTVPDAAKIDAILNGTVVYGGANHTRTEYFAYYGLDGPNGVGTKAAMVGWLLAEAEKAALGPYVLANTAFLKDAADGQAQYATNLLNSYAPAPTDPSGGQNPGNNPGTNPPTDPSPGNNPGANNGNNGNNGANNPNAGSAPTQPSTPADTDAGANQVAEGAAAGSSTGLRVNSVDSLDLPITYSIESDTSKGGFKVDSVTGVVTVADPSKLDYESLGAPKTHTVTIKAANSAALSSTKSFDIAITDVAPTAPADANAAANSVAEGAAAGTVVGLTVAAAEPNGPAPTYSITADSSNGGFKVDAATGVVTVADASKLDYETSGAGHAYSLTVKATTGALSNSQSFSVAVTDVALPVPTDANASANTVAEGAAAGTLVGVTAQANDVNGPATAYSLSNSANGAFQIDAATGVVSVADASKIDFESSGGAYTVTVKADAGVGGSTTQDFTLAVTDVALPALADTDAAANSVAEGAALNTVVGITAESKDVNGPATAYSLTNSANGAFKIDAATGVVSVADPSKLDFESSGGSYTLTVEADAGAAGSTTKDFTVAVTDVALPAIVDTDAAANTVVEGAAANTVVGVTAQANDVNGPATTYSLTNSANGAFKIDSATGVISVADASKLDFESSAGSLTLTAKADAGAAGSTTKDFTIAVTNAAPSTPVDNNAAADTVAEGAANGSTVGITASSTDVNGPNVTYSLTGDTSGGGFTINAATGVVTVADSAKVNYETSGAGKSYNLTVQASDGTAASTQSFTVGVTNVAPSTPVDNNANANAVAEGAAAGTNVGITASSTDVNGPDVTYSLTGDTSGGGFTIDAATGVVTVADPTKIDYEASPGHAYAITVQASDGTAVSTKNFTIAVNDVAPSVPTDSNNATDTVVEGAAAGSTVGVTAASTDPNGPAPTYSLIGDTSGGGFTVNATTGVITVADPSKLNFETAASHTVTVQASDGTLAASQAFVIAVTNAAPSTPVDSNASADTVTEGAAANTLVGVTVNATDVNGPAVTYSLTNNANGAFKINATTGVVSVADGSKIDFETSGGSYTITAQASDGTAASTQNFTITIDDIAPSVPADANGAANAVDEGAAVGTSVGVTASSTDVNGPGVTYSLVGNPGGAFKIDAATGVVSVADPAKVNYEDSTTLTIIVQASDGTLASTQTFDIAINDIAPSTPSDKNSAANSVVEGATSGSAVGLTVTATDISGGAVVYSLTDTANGAFQIDFTTGVVTVADASKINYETSGAGGLNITAIASDGTLNSASKTFNIAVANAPPSAPADVNNSPNAVNEGAAADALVGITASSTDVNGGTVTYSLANSANGAFKINSTTGVISVADGSKIDFDSSGGSYSVVVQASDGVANSTQTFTVNVNNVAPAAPTDANLAADTVLEGAANGTAVGVTAASTDPSGGALAYSLADDAGGRFVIDPATGVVTVANASLIDYETAPGHAYTIVARATDGGGLFSQTTFNIAVGDVALAAPTDTNAAVDTVAEGAAVNTAVGITARAVDPNGPATVYSLTNSAGGAYQIDASTGVVTVADASKINYETSGGSHNITVKADAGAAGFTTQTFAVAVTNVAPSTPVDSDGAANSVRQYAANGATVGITGSATDVNGPAVAYSLTGDTSGGAFAINASTGVVTVADRTKLAYNAANPNYSITIDASDGSAHSQQSFNIAVVPNAQPTLTVGGTLAFTENEAAKVVNSTLVASDADGPAVGQATVQITGNHQASDQLGVTGALPAFWTHSFNPATGTLTISPAAGATMAQMQSVLRQVTFLNNTENPSGLARTLTWTVTDTELNATATSTVNVTPVNDAPTAVGSSVSGLEDVAYTFQLSDFQFTDAAEGHGLQAIKLSSNPTSGTLKLNGATVNSGDTISATDITNGKLTFTGAANASGSPYGAFGFYVQDNGGTANGGVDWSSNAASMVVALASVNDAPSGQNATLSATQNTAFTLTTANFGFSDTNDSPANSFSAVQITALPTAGTLTKGGVAVTAGQTISVADINANLLTYTATGFGNAYATIGFKVQDNGGTSNGGIDLDPTANTLTFNVASANQAPTANNVTLNGASSANYNTALVVNDPADGAPSVTGPAKTVNASLKTLSGAADANGDALTFTVATNQNTSDGGKVTIQADGDFVYQAKTGTSATSDTFSFTINDGNGGSVTKTATVALQGAKIWYVDATNGNDTTGDGSSSNPYASLSKLNGTGNNGATTGDPDGAGDIIYLRGGTYSSGITLENNQQLISRAYGLTVGDGGAGTVTLDAASGSNAVINGTVTLATGNTLRGLDFGTTAATAYSLNGGSSVGALTISNSSVNNATGGGLNIGSGGTLDVSLSSFSAKTTSSVSALALTNASGTVSIASGGAITGSGTTQTAVNLSGGSVSLSLGSSINETGTGIGVQAQNMTGGTQTFSGAIASSAGKGVNLTGNTGATFTFSGGLSLSTTTSEAFTATGGGTVNATGTNTLATTTATALTVTSTTIGSSNLNFQSVSANGAAKGISLNNTGSSGGLVITGVGTTDGSGGVIQNITTRGVELINTNNVSISNLQLTNANTSNSGNNDNSLVAGSFGGLDSANGAIVMNSVTGATLTNVDIGGTTADNGIGGTAVKNLTIANSTITRSGIAASGEHDSAIRLYNLSGTSSITNSDLSFSQTNVFEVFNNDASLNLTITGSTLRDTQTVFGGGTNDNGEGGFQFVSASTGAGAPTSNIIIKNSNFLRLRTQGVQVIGQNDSIVNVDITGSTINSFTDIGAGVDINGNDTAVVKFNVNNNTIQSKGGSAVNITSFLNSNVMGRVNNNTLSVSTAGSAIRFLAQESSQMTVEAKVNNATADTSAAIDAQARGGSARLDLTLLQNKTATGPTALVDINITAGSSANGETNAVYVNLANNIATSNGADVKSLRLRVSDANGSSDPRIFLQGFVSKANADASAEATWAGNGNTPTASGDEVTVSLTGSATAPSAGTPNLPSNPAPAPLTAAPGGVAAAVAVESADLTQGMLDSVVGAALDLWGKAGATAAQLASLSSLRFSIANLAGQAVGEQQLQHVFIDLDAAGHGWFVDATPQDNVEFAHASADGALFADPTSAAAGRLDLLTTVLHEMGHQLGLADLANELSVGNLMYGDLVNGERRLPTAADLAAIQAAAHGEPLKVDISDLVSVLPTSGVRIHEDASGGSATLQLEFLTDQGVIWADVLQINGVHASDAVLVGVGDQTALLKAEASA